MEQLILHLIGDYVFQNNWIANNKTKSHWICALHAALYSLPFLLITTPLAVGIIFCHHFLVDRYRLAVDYIKFFNQSEDKSNFGFPKETPAFISFWVMVIVDNTIHLSLNYLTLLYV